MRDDLAAFWRSLSGVLLLSLPLRSILLGPTKSLSNLCSSMFSIDCFNMCALILVGDFFKEPLRRFWPLGCLSAKNCCVLSKVEMSTLRFLRYFSSSLGSESGANSVWRAIADDCLNASSLPGCTILTLALRVGPRGGLNLRVSTISTISPSMLIFTAASLTKMSFGPTFCALLELGLLESLYLSKSCSSFSNMRSSSSL